jgi:AAA domain
MTGTIDRDGFCTRCGEVADWCECPALPDEAEPDDAFPAAPPDTSDTPQEPVSENPDALTSEKDTSDTSDSGVKYELRDAAWLDGQDFPPLKYAIAGLMPAGLGIIAAPPKAGKSLLILDWLLAAANGGHALGRIGVGPARDVLYLALEDGDRRLQFRCRQLLADGEPIPDRLRYILTVPPGQVLAVLTDALERHPETRLIVLDTLGRIMPLPFQGETTYQRDYRVAVALKRIADEHPGLAIVVIHHTRKAFADDFIDSISGTHGLAGAADTIIMLTRARGRAEGTMRVTGRDVIEADYAVIFRDGAWSLDGADLKEARANVRRHAETGALGERSAEIIEFIRGRPSGAKAQEIEDKFGPDGTRYVRRLARKGRLTRPKRGLYVVSEVSEVSESQVSDPEKPDTAQLPLSGVSEPPTGGDDQ